MPEMWNIECSYLLFIKELLRLWCLVSSKDYLLWLNASQQVLGHTEVSKLLLYVYPMNDSKKAIIFVDDVAQDVIWVLVVNDTHGV